MTIDHNGGILVRTREGKPVDMAFGPDRHEVSREIVLYFHRLPAKHVAPLYRSVYGPSWHETYRDWSVQNFNYEPRHRASASEGN